MPKMVVTHAVVELDRWLQGKAERAEVIGRHATNVTDYVAADGAPVTRRGSGEPDLNGSRPEPQHRGALS